ncbi:MAG: ABC transporter permease subunit [Spirochaetaceae bacterium]|jgi:ABC-2 type transport system permease protein|nr:ABC transporter permease subunit [Spirochaetaceae bacterium]
MEKFQYKKITALVRKELFGFIISPASYGIALFFLLFTSIWFFNVQNFFVRNTATLRPYFAGFPLVFILVVPGITMKSWAEERKMGSLELLLTLPFSEWELVLAKFFAALGMLVSLLVLSLPLPLSLLPLGNFDGGVIFCEYFGALLLGASATALGLLLSALSKNQIAAFLGAAAALLAVMLINQVQFTQAIPAPLSRFLNFISLNFHFESFSKGLLDSRDLLFFLITTVLFLFLNTRVLLFRKFN